MADITSNLELYLKLDETSGLVATDASGGGNHGNLDGGLDFANNSVAGQIGNALDVTGNGRRISFGDQSDFEFTTGAFTLACWFNTDLPGATSVSRTTLLNKQHTGLLINPGYRLNVWAGKLRFLIGDGAFSDFVQNETLVNDGQNHFACLTMSSAKEMTLYLDQEAPIAKTHALGSLDTSIALGVGGLAWVTTFGFDGWLDDFRIYSRELAAEDVTALYNFTGESLALSSSTNVGLSVSV